MTAKTDDRQDRKAGAARGGRLASALRANLQRRKAQARARSAAPRDAASAPHDSAGIVDDKAAN